MRPIGHDYSVRFAPRRRCNLGRSLGPNGSLYRDGLPIAFLEGDATRLLEPVEPEIENMARLALHGHAKPAAHLPRLRRLAQLEAARASGKKRRGAPAGPFAA